MLALLVMSRNLSFLGFLELPLVKVPCALNCTVPPTATGLVADTGEQASVGVGVGVCFLVGVGVRVGACGEPVQITMEDSESRPTAAGAGAPLELPLPLNHSAVARKESTGTSTRHLRHQNIEPKAMTSAYQPVKASSCGAEQRMCFGKDLISTVRCDAQKKRRVT